MLLKFLIQCDKNYRCSLYIWKIRYIFTLGGGVAKNHEYQENRSSDVLLDSTPKCVSIHI